jgi:hypothetical protein
VQAIRGVNAMIETDQSERSVFLQAIEIASAEERAIYL